MIRPVERPPGMGKAPPYACESEVLVDWLLRIERAVNMLIEHVNTLTDAAFGGMSYDSHMDDGVILKREYLKTEHDPNEATDD